MPDMNGQRPGLLIASITGGLLLVFYFLSTYHLLSLNWGQTGVPLTASDQLIAKRVPSSPSRPSESTVGKVLGQNSILSNQEIYQQSTPAVALIEVYDDEGHQRGQGSGFAISSSGTLITNYHVIRGASRATANFNGQPLIPVIGVLGYDSEHDVAAVKLASSPTGVLRLGNSDATQVGENVVVIGSPLGLQNTLSEGIISAKRGGLIQMSAPISPGSSGGPVLDRRGDVIGIAVMTSRQGQNLNFAVPIDWAKGYAIDGSARPLMEIVAENTVVGRIYSDSVTIPAGQARSWQISVNRNLMSNAEIHGEVTSSGGLDAKITVGIYHGNEQIFLCRESHCSVHQDISEDGKYLLMLDNRMSPFFSRTVTGEIILRYVK